MENVEYVGQWGEAISDFAILGDYLLVIQDAKQLRVVEVSDPAQPVVVGEMAPYAEPIWIVTAAGRYAYLADGGVNLRVVELTDSAHPIEVAAISIVPAGRCVGMRGAVAYMRDDSRGLWAVDIADPAHPVVVGFYQMAEQVNTTTISGDYAILLDLSNQVWLVDITDPAHLSEAASFQGAWEITYAANMIGGYLYASVHWWDMGQGLEILNLSNPSEPGEEGAVQTPGIARLVGVAGSYAYWLIDGAGVLVEDISDHAQPVAVGHYYFDERFEWLQGAEIYGEYIYVREHDGWLHILRFTGGKQ